MTRLTALFVTGKKLIEDRRKKYIEMGRKGLAA